MGIDRREFRTYSTFCFVVQWAECHSTVTLFDRMLYRAVHQVVVRFRLERYIVIKAAVTLMHDVSIRKKTEEAYRAFRDLGDQDVLLLCEESFTMDLHVFEWYGQVVMASIVYRALCE